MQVRLGVHIHAAVLGFHIALVGDAAAGGGHGHRGTGRYDLVVGHGLTGSQLHILAARYGSLVMQVGLGIHVHTAVFGFHIALVGDAAAGGGHGHGGTGRYGLVVGHGLTGSQFHILAGFHHTQVVQVGLGIHVHAAVLGFHITLVGDAAAGGGHGHRGTGRHCAGIAHGFTGLQIHRTSSGRQRSAVGQRGAGLHLQVPSSGHSLVVGHAAAGSQPCILAGFHHTQVVQFRLGIHGHIAVFGFHIALVGDAAGIGSQVHTLAARYGTLVVQIGLGFHGHVTVLGFHIALVGDAAGIGFHGHRGTCLYDALVEDCISRCQFHLLCGDQTLVDHAFGGVQDDFVPSQAVFILQRPGRVFMEPAAAHGQGTCGLQIGFVVDQADAFCDCHRPVDGQVIHRTVHVVADGNVLCLAVIVEGNGQVLTAAAADDHIGGIAAVLHSHGLEVVEDFLVIQLGSALQVDAGSGLQIGCGCRDGMARSLADMSAGLQGQGIRGQAAFGQVDGTGCVQRHFGSFDLAVHSRHAVRCFPSGLHRTFALQDEFVLALHVGQGQGTGIPAAQVDIPLFGVGAEYAGILHPQSVLCQTQAAVRGNQVHFVAVDVAAGLAAFGGHLHAGIGTQADHAAGHALERQDLGCTVVQPGLVQVQIALGPGIQTAAQVGQDVVGAAADITGTTGDGQIPGGDAAFLHLHALVAHKLHIGAGADLPGDIQDRVLHSGQIDAACPGGVAAVGVQGHLSAVQLEGDRLLLPDRQTGIVPGQIPGLGLGQDLEVLQFVQIRIGDFLGRSIHADVLPGIQGDILPFDVGGVHRHHFILGRSVEHAVLDGVEQVILAPAVGLAAAYICISQDEILFFRGVALAVEIGLPGGVIGLVRCFQGRIVTGVGFHSLFVGGFRCLQTGVRNRIGSIVRGLCFVAVQGMAAVCGSQFGPLYFQTVQPFLLRCFRSLGMAVRIFVGHQAHFLPQAQFILAAGKGPFASHILEAAVRGQSHVPIAGDNVAQPHIAAAAGIGQGNIPGGLGIQAGRQRITVHRGVCRGHGPVNGTLPADQVDPVPLQGTAALQVPVRLQIEAAAAGHGLVHRQIALVGFQGHAAAVTVQADGRPSPQGAVGQSDIALGLSRQAVRIHGSPVLGGDAAGRAGQGHLAAAARRRNTAGQIHIFGTGDGNGILALGQKAHIDGFVRLDGVGTAGGIPHRLRPSVFGLPITKHLAPEAIVLGGHRYIAVAWITVIDILFRGHFVGIILFALGDDHTGIQSLVPGNLVFRRSLDIPQIILDAGQEFPGVLVLDQTPGQEILVVLMDLHRLAASSPARPFQGLGIGSVHGGVHRTGGHLAAAVGHRHCGLSAIVPVLRLLVAVGILDADQPVDILVPDGVHRQIPGHRTGVDGNIRCAVHGHQTAGAAGAGHRPVDVDLAAGRRNGFRQQMLRGRVVIGLHSVFPDAPLLVVVGTPVVDQVAGVAQHLVVSQGHLVEVPGQVLEEDLAVIRHGQGGLVSVIPALDQSVDDHVLARQIHVLSGVDAGRSILVAEGRPDGFFFQIP